MTVALVLSTHMLLACLNLVNRGGVVRGQRQFNRRQNSLDLGQDVDCDLLVVEHTLLKRHVLADINALEPTDLELGDVEEQHLLGVSFLDEPEALVKLQHAALKAACGEFMSFNGGGVGEAVVDTPLLELGLGLCVHSLDLLRCSICSGCCCLGGHVALLDRCSLLCSDLTLLVLVCGLLVHELHVG